MRYVSDILAAKKKSEIYTISPNETVYTAINFIAKMNIGALLVTENNRLEGTISERDYARKVILKGKLSRTTKVCEIMTNKTLHVSPKCRIEQCMSTMLDNQVRDLPVLDNDLLVGLVSMEDVMKDILNEKEFVIDELSKYIAGSPMYKSGYYSQVN